MPLQIRRGTEAERLALVPSNGLVVGELLYETDTDKIFIGTGRDNQHKGVVVTGYTNEEAVDAVADALVAGTHTSISFTYGTTQDNASRIDATVDLSNYSGTITADAFRGSVYADDTSLLIDGVTGRIVGPVFSDVTGNLNGNVTGALTGDVLGNLTGNVTGDVLGNLTGNVTGDVLGDLIGNTTGYHTGDVAGSVFADDSTMLVDAVSSTIVGNVNNDIVNTKRLNISATDTNDIGILINTNAGGDDGIDLFNINTYHDDVDAIGAFFSRSKGTYAAPTTLSDGDAIFKLVFAGSTTDGSFEPSSAIVGSVDGTVGAGILPGSISIYTTTAAGAITPKLIIGSEGQQTITAPALVVGGGSGQVDAGTISSWMKVTFNGVEYAVPMYAIRP